MKKKVYFFAFIITFLLILIYRYSINYKDNNEINQNRTESTLVLNDFNGVIMTVESVVDTKITVLINYSADDEVTFGEDYILEVKKGKKWYSLPANDDIMFTSIGYALKKGSDFTWSTDFEILYGKLASGHYRIIKGFSTESQQGNPKEYYISAEFSI
ncbi:immunoglobulin-like domain-containing protein [Clostridium sp. E02]|uniref:immunoglobulin-like domain-containing protein n=1 Tax=Clostridium sp. E02 TaxID=2487134 RepID=UPI000F52F46F|nr:immunoglobulin-like domain-containing protein [Clostridium sp. E02]